MASRKGTVLNDLLFGLAETPLLVQRHLNEAYLAHEHEFEEIMCKAPDVIQDAINPLRSIRYQVHEFDITLKSLMTVSRKKGFEIYACPINIGYHLRYGSSARMENTITISIEQVPLSLEWALQEKPSNLGGTENG